MPTEILMPALSPTMEKGNLARWLKKEGDIVKSGDILAEIETDKATMEVEAVDEGVLAKILVPDGTADVAVNQPIGVIAGEGEDAEAAAANVAAAKGPAAPKAAPPSGQAAAAPVAAGPAAAPPGGSEARSRDAPPSPRRSEEVAARGAPATRPAGNGHDRAERIFASPLARRLAKEAGLDLAAITGSGPRGRIVERDIAAARAAEPGRPAAATPSVAAPAPVTATAGEERVRKLFEPGSFEAVPHDSMRKVIARRLTEAKQTIPHFYLTLDCEIDALLALREQINAVAPSDKDGKSAYKVSVNDFVIKALALALMRVPEANVTWTDAAMLKHRHADVGVAVAIPGGLMTPVVRRAETKTLSAISREMKDYAARARARRLKPEEYQGGSTAVSNLGMYGIKSFAAVINPPHATILAVGAGETRVVVKAGAPAVATIMSATLSTDHRAVDGAIGAELLAAFKALIENPLAMLV